MHYKTDQIGIWHKVDGGWLDDPERHIETISRLGWIEQQAIFNRKNGRSAYPVEFRSWNATFLYSEWYIRAIKQLINELKREGKESCLTNPQKISQTASYTRLRKIVRNF